MKKLLQNYPIIYLLLFLLLAFVAGYEIGHTIKNGLPEQNSASYLKISGITINLILSFYFLNIFIKAKKKH